MKTIEVNDYDSTCFDASVSAGHFNNDSYTEYAAIPDIYAGAVKATAVARKYSNNYVLLEFPGKKVRIASFIDTSPEAAIKEALQALKEDNKTENDIEWWEDVD